MSTNNVNKEQLEEKVVVNEVETKQIVPVVEESTKSKWLRRGKKAGKWILLGLFGCGLFAAGRASKKSEPKYYEENSEVVEGEIVDSED